VGTADEGATDSIAGPIVADDPLAGVVASGPGPLNPPSPGAGVPVIPWTSPGPLGQNAEATRITAAIPVSVIAVSRRSCRRAGGTSIPRRGALARRTRSPATTIRVGARGTGPIPARTPSGPDPGETRFARPGRVVLARSRRVSVERPNDRRRRYIPIERSSRSTGPCPVRRRLSQRTTTSAVTTTTPAIVARLSNGTSPPIRSDRPRRPRPRVPRVSGMHLESGRIARVPRPRRPRGTHIAG